MVNIRFTLECRSKGYTATQICRMLNRRGVSVGINEFREAVKDKKNKSPREELVTKEARKILRELPELSTCGNGLMARASQHGFNITDVWKCHQASGIHPVTKGVFYNAIKDQRKPFQKRLCEEAERTLDEMIAKQSKA